MYKYLLSSFAIILIYVIYLFYYKDTERTITYFPMTDEIHFTQAMTSLNQRNETLLWTVTSETDETIYLRQDVSILFENGYLKGVLSKWKQNESIIKQQKEISLKSNSCLSSLSYHHGERHSKNEEKIESIQKMSTSFIYFSKEKEDNTYLLKQNCMEGKIPHYLKDYWEDLMNFYNINKKDYMMIPLVLLSRYEKENFPNFSSKKTDQVIGQMWEGLYKNYVLQSVEEQASDLMPLILLAKDGSHLYVLYSIDGKNEKLIQLIQ